MTGLVEYKHFYFHLASLCTSRDLKSGDLFLVLEYQVIPIIQAEMVVQAAQAEMVVRAAQAIHQVMHSISKEIQEFHHDITKTPMPS